MNKLIASTFLLGTLFGFSSPANAETRFRISIGNDRHYDHHSVRHDYRRPSYRPHYSTYRPWRPARVVYTQPVIVRERVYVAPPPPPVQVSELTGEYATDWSNLHTRVTRLRNVVERQHEKDILSRSQHDRLMDSLDSITRDARARAYDRGGNLRREDFAEFYRRLDHTNEDLTIALAG